MYENVTYETLLDGMLDYALQEAGKRGQDLDSREGSMLWYGSAPAAVEAQNLYIQLDTVLRETFADTSSRPYLLRRALERGLSPKPASPAVGRAEFTPPEAAVPIGTRFSLGALNYVLTSHEDGVYQVTCETAGAAANGQTGQLIPIDYVPGLSTARLAEVLIPGEDEQDTESFRQEYLDSFSSQAFGGNAADYQQKVRDIPGVAGVKVHRAWNGDIRPADFVPPASFGDWYAALTGAPEEVLTWLQTVARAAGEGLLTVGGTVRLVVIGADYGPPSAELLDRVQTAIDPEANHGEGIGLAPIGHYVTVRGVEGASVDMGLHLTFETGWDWASARSYVEKAVDTYFLELSQSWADTEEGIVVRVSALESRILALPGVVDVEGTTLNGTAKNLQLGADQIPKRGVVSGT